MQAPVYVDMDERRGFIIEGRLCRLNDCPILWPASIAIQEEHIWNKEGDEKEAGLEPT